MDGIINKTTDAEEEGILLQRICSEIFVNSINSNFTFFLYTRLGIVNKDKFGDELLVAENSKFKIRRVGRSLVAL